MPSHTDLSALYSALGEEGLKKARWQEHMRALSRLFGLIFTLLWAWIWLASGASVGLGQQLGDNVWAFALIYLLLFQVFTLPLDLVFDHFLEVRLGTTRQGFWGWLWDWFKGALINTAVFSLFFGLAYTAFRLWPRAWLLGALGSVAVLLVLIYLLQYVLLRSQFKTEPLEDRELDARLKRLFAKAGFAYGGVEVVRAGEKTSRGNAALVPKGGALKVVLFDNLLEALSPEGIEVVVAHELGHRAHRDILWLLGFYGLLFLSGLALAHSAAAWVASSLGVGPSDAATLPVFHATLILWLLITEIAANAFSRQREFLADRYAIALTQNLPAFEETFITLARQNFADPEPPAWIEWLFHNHPSIAKRIAAAKEAMAGLKV